MPKLQALHCDKLGLIFSQYAEYKIRYRGSIQMIAPAVEVTILNAYSTYLGYSTEQIAKFYPERERETFFRYQELLAARPA